MSGPINSGGPAFPCEVPADYRDTEPTKFPGMTLRDWFAGNERIDDNEEFGVQILESLVGPRPEGTWSSNPLEWLDWDSRWRAAIRYSRADAMIAARKGGAK